MTMPRLWPIFTFLFLAVLSIEGVFYYQDLSTSFILLAAAIAFGAMTLVKGYEWLSWLVLDRQERHRHILAITPDLILTKEKEKLAETIRGLRDEQLKLLDTTGLGIDIDINAKHYIRGTSIEIGPFLYEFLLHSKGPHLCARSHFGGIDSIAYKMADEITKRFIFLGLATEERDGPIWRNGPFPAIWLHEGTAEKLLELYFGIEAPSPTPA